MRSAFHQFSGRSRRAFTLLEVVIAIALSGILLTAAAGIVMNTVQLWEKSDNVVSIDRHLAGLDRFLSSLLEAQSSQAIARTEDGKTVTGCTWTTPPNMDETFPCFVISKSYPILQLREKPIPAVTAWLFWDSDGLWLVTQTPRQKNESEDYASFTLLSPLLDYAEILYWEDESGTWETIDSVDEVTLQSRTIRVVFHFKKDRQMRERSFTFSKIQTGGMIY